jgi:putative glutamine amidotransferase
VQRIDHREPLPRIGLSAYREHAAWGVWHEPADLLPATYSDAIELAGGVPLLLPAPTSDVVLRAQTALDGVDGLLLSGGPDLDPARYGAQRSEQTGAPRAERDAWEIALALAAMERDLPVLGVCRGLQTLNVALGGTLIQHLPDRVGHAGHCPTVGIHGRHPVTTLAGSRICQVHGPAADVATYHHQAVDEIATGLVASAWADDGVVEAVELQGAAWVVAVQWHPEVHNGGDLFDAFVNACRSSRLERSPLDRSPLDAVPATASQ